MPKSTVVALPAAEPRQRLAARRRARAGDRLALPLLVGGAAGRPPPAIAAVWCCSRSRVYRTVRASRAGTLGVGPDDPGQPAPPGRTTVRLPTPRRARRARLKAAPRAAGWWRTRWRCATLALTRQPTRGLTVSAETRRRGRQAIGWVGTRANRVAKDDEPPRVARGARRRYLCAPRTCCAAWGFADALARHLWPTVGAAWRPPGTQLEVLPPGQHHTPSWAGALELSPGTRHDCRGPRQTTAWCHDRRTRLDGPSPADP